MLANNLCKSLFFSGRLNYTTDILRALVDAAIRRPQPGALNSVTFTTFEEGLRSAILAIGRKSIAFKQRPGEPCERSRYYEGELSASFRFQALWLIFCSSRADVRSTVEQYLWQLVLSGNGTSVSDPIHFSTLPASMYLSPHRSYLSFPHAYFLYTDR